MFRHVLLLRWKDDATDHQKKAAYDAVVRLPEVLPMIRAWHVGEDVGVRPDETTNFDFAIIADFDSADDYLAYRHDPAHLDVIEKFTLPIVAEISRVQYFTDADLK